MVVSQILKITLVHVLSLAGIWRIYSSFESNPSIKPIAISLAIIVVAIIVFIYCQDFSKIINERPKSYKIGSKKILKYMRKWVSVPGRTTIFSRDMSWARDAESKKVLCEKAAAGDLTILVETENSLVSELRAAGARVIMYGRIGHVPKSRFTIVGFERGGARVAIGAPIGSRHVIEEFHSGVHPQFDVTDDLVQFLIKADGVRS